MYKRIRNVVVTVILCVSVMALPVSAVEPQEMERSGIQLMSVDTRKNIGTLNVSKGKAACVARVRNKSSKLITISMSLQKYSAGRWKTIKSWSGSKTGMSYVLTRTASVSKGKYRVKAVMRSGSDTITQYSQTVNY